MPVLTPVRSARRRAWIARAVVVPALLTTVLVGTAASALAVTPTPTPAGPPAGPSGTAAPGTAAPGTASPAATGTPGPEAVAAAKAAREAAQKQVADFKAQADQASATLAEGSKRLEAEQAALAAVQAQQQAARGRADEAVARADAARVRLQVVVGQSFRSSVPDPVQLALTSTPDGIRDAVVARADLDRVYGSADDALRQAKALRVAADAAVRTAQQLTDQATAKEAAVAADVAQLTTFAEQTRQSLQVAANALVAAQQAEIAAQDAAAQAAADAAARAAAAAAAARSADQARLAALRAAQANRPTLALCTQQPTGTLVNGFLDPSTLCPLDDAPGEALQPAAAAAFNALNAAYKAQYGSPLCVTDSYRSYAEQVAVFVSRPGLAATPGRSNHGLGVALDLCGGVENFGSAAYLWMKVNAARFGWFHPGWAEPTGSLPEAWHWEYADGGDDSANPSS